MAKDKNMNEFDDDVELLDLNAPAPETSESASNPDDEEEEEDTRHGHGGLVLCLVVVILLLGMFAGGAYGLMYYGGGFNPNVFFANTYINGMNVGGETVNQVYDSLATLRSDYELTITERGGAETINGADFDLGSRPDKADIQAILDEKNSKSYFDLMYQYIASASYTVDVVDSYDEDMLIAAVDSLNCLNPDLMEAPVDSELVKDDSGYRITGSSDGTTLDIETARNAIIEQLEHLGTSVDLVDMGVYTSASVTEDDADLNAEIDKIESILNTSITYELGDQTYTLDREFLEPLIQQDEEGEWGVDRLPVAQWVATMAANTDTYQKHDGYVTYTGQTYDLEKGNFGWQINQADTIDALMEYISEGAQETVEPVYYYRGIERDGKHGDLGGTWVEVDITNQKVYLFVNYELKLTTDCVTGQKGSSDRETPSWGIWAISYKQSPATLGTYAVQGYESAVTYWMPFNGGVGLHDAAGWRYYYGGNIYTYNGSHGCVNLPLDAAATIYQNVSAGIPVVVYGE